jgi:hypothetical protein
MTPKQNEHCLLLGKLVANFQSLEFILRVFLQLLPNALPSSVPHGMDIYKLPVGTELSVDEITSYDTLGVLINRFNNEMKLRGQSIIDQQLVALRDAIAHGRVSGAGLLNDDSELKLIKFSKPDKQTGKVRIDFNQLMTKDWLNEQVMRVNHAIRSVYDALPDTSKSI